MPLYSSVHSLHCLNRFTFEIKQSTEVCKKERKSVNYKHKRGWIIGEREREMVSRLSWFDRDKWPQSKTSVSLEQDAEDKHWVSSNLRERERKKNKRRKDATFFSSFCYQAVLPVLRMEIFPTIVFGVLFLLTEEEEKEGGGRDEGD